jgi:hypothetical protein
MSKGNSPIDHHTVCREPLMLGANGNIISRAEFARRCRIATPYHDKQYRHFGKVTRLRGLYFGRDESSLRWKYHFRMYVSGGKKELLKRAYDAILLNSIGAFVQDDPYETFDFNYDQKISLYV